MNSKYIKYERIRKTYSNDELNDYLGSIVKNGYEIVYYNEEPIGIIDTVIVTMVLGKLRIDPSILKG